MSDELNLAREILQGRSFKDVPDTEILDRSRQLFEDWMSGELRMERPKVYDHYALVIAALNYMTAGGCCTVRYAAAANAPSSNTASICSTRRTTATPGTDLAAPGKPKNLL